MCCSLRLHLRLHISQQGLSTIPIIHDTYAIAKAWYDDCDTGINLGMQPNGFYLCLLDLDSHIATQEARCELARLEATIGPVLFHRLAIQISRSDKGYHIPVLLPFDPKFAKPTIKLWNTNGAYIGELLSAGMYMVVRETWMQGGTDQIPHLCMAEWSQLCDALGINSAHSTATLTSSRKECIREGYQRIRGWHGITNWQLLLDQKYKTHTRLSLRLAKLRTDPNRSDSYGNFVQSLMLHATTWGRTDDERSTLARSSSQNQVR